MQSKPRIAVERATDGGIVVVAHTHDGRPLRETGYSLAEAKQLAAAIFAAVLAPDTDDLPTGQRLSVWLDALSELVGLLDDEDDDDELADVEGYSVGGRQ